MQPRTRNSREETRALLLTAGVESLLDQPAMGIRHIKATDVVDRVGLTSGAFYNIWESQGAYHDDLIDAVFDPANWPTVEGTADVAAAMAAKGATFEEFLRAGAEIAWSQLVDGEAMLRLQFALWSVGDPAIDPLIARQYRVMSERWTNLFGTIVELYDLEIRPGRSLEELSVSLTGLIEGLFARHVLERRVGQRGRHLASPDLFARGVVALVLDTVAVKT